MRRDLGQQDDLDECEPQDPRRLERLPPLRRHRLRKPRRATHNRRTSAPGDIRLRRNKHSNE